MIARAVTIAMLRKTGMRSNKKPRPKRPKIKNQILTASVRAGRTTCGGNLDAALIAPTSCRERSMEEDVGPTLISKSRCQNVSIQVICPKTWIRWPFCTAREPKKKKKKKIIDSHRTEGNLTLRCPCDCIDESRKPAGQERLLRRDAPWDWHRNIHSLQGEDDSNRDSGQGIERQPSEVVDRDPIHERHFVGEISSRATGCSSESTLDQPLRPHNVPVGPEEHLHSIDLALQFIHRCC